MGLIDRIKERKHWHSGVPFVKDGVRWVYHEGEKYFDPIDLQKKLAPDAAKGAYFNFKHFKRKDYVKLNGTHTRSAHKNRCPKAWLSSRHIEDFRLYMKNYNSHKKRKGDVYFAQNEKTRAYKIGFTTNVKVRMAQFNVASEHKINLKHKIKGSLHDETMIHSVLSESGNRIKGEWFNCERTELFISILQANKEDIKLTCSDFQKEMVQNLTHMINLSCGNEAS